jgi:hypothetical protein
MTRGALIAAGALLAYLSARDFVLAPSTSAEAVAEAAFEGALPAAPHGVRVTVLDAAGADAAAPVYRAGADAAAPVHRGGASRLRFAFCSS